jgi:hypothetical protein
MSRTRRDVIALGLSVVAAGCVGETETSTGRNGRLTPGEAANAETVVDPPTVALRHENEDPLVGFQPTPTDEDAYHSQLRFVADRETAERMDILAAVEGQRAVRSFLDETDFEQETVYVSRRGVGACHELKPCYVSWSDGDVHVQYARLYRSPDVACSTEERHRVVTLFRIPEAVDPDAINSFGGGTQSGGCPSRRRRRGRGGAAPIPRGGRRPDATTARNGSTTTATSDTAATNETSGGSE